MDKSPIASSKASSGVRAAAVRKAHEATARRDAERLKRERELETALIDFYAALAHIEKVRVKAERDAAPFENDAEEAVRRMARLGEPVAAVAELTKLPGTQVRAILAGVKGAGPSSGGSAREAHSVDVPPPTPGPVA